MKGIRFRKIAAILLAALVLCALPVAAFAESNTNISAVQPYALGTGHNISVKIYKVVLDSSKPLGYQTPELVTTITVTCTDGTGHSGYNPFVKLKEFYPTNVGLDTKNWVGWEFNGYYSGGKGNTTFYSWISSSVNATANVTGSEPYPCSKNFYLIYDQPELTPTPTPTPTPTTEPTTEPTTSPSPDPVNPTDTPSATPSPKPEQPENDVPQTGDSADYFPWIALLSIGALGLAAICV